ncbi:hypothetical protein [Wohlfahrtiimonas chitiniclastica]|uniref:hypothetical protein n=1 Tax=Wohlfahrtiimonas chitiniclastica TaxID=400946 RepID=UPI000B9986F0|nr:hypothetical protein [Wohlfahrtiimonas chitiniclastica]MBS7837326.1 hypothetical protein [Wohlfahrtiimonas chitiniclastica]OYQ90478.1 hypothetical protein B9T10_03935 [Wohlfahrtiimonas chitiniclastica]
MQQHYHIHNTRLTVHTLAEGSLCIEAMMNDDTVELLMDMRRRYHGRFHLEYTKMVFPVRYTARILTYLEKWQKKAPSQDGAKRGKERVEHRIVN